MLKLHMIMSTTSNNDISAINPFIEDTKSILNNIEEILLRVSRVRHGNRIVDAAKKMKKLLHFFANHLKKKNIFFRSLLRNYSCPSFT